MPLSPEQLEFYNENGFIGPVEIIPPDEMAALADSICDEILIESEATRSVYGFHTNRDVHLFSQRVLRLASHPNLVQNLVQLLGPNIVFWRSTVFHKPPQTANLDATGNGFGDVDWHQGMDFITPALDLMTQKPSLGFSRAENLKNFPLNITAWIGIDEATELSGTLVFAPGSHRLGPVDYEKVVTAGGFNRTGFKSKYEGLFDTSKNVIVEVPAGSCILFNNLVYHKSLPNRTQKRRLGIACRYVGSSVPVYPNGDPAGLDISSWNCVLIAGRNDAVANKSVKSVSEILGES